MDRSAIEDLLIRHSPAVAERIAREISPRWQTMLSVDDVMQQTWLDAFLKIETCQAKDDQGFSSWLLRVARNNLIDAVRKLDADKRGGDRQPVQNAGTWTNSLHDSILGIDSRTPSRLAANDEAERSLRAALEDLPRDYRIVVQMYDLEGHPIEDVAAATKRSPGAVHMLRSRAHALLREVLAGHTGKSKIFRECGRPPAPD